MTHITLRNVHNIVLFQIGKPALVCQLLIIIKSYVEKYENTKIQHSFINHNYTSQNSY